ncbi:hypothetical protein AURDEDRAFT_19202, partial [Auricularia subglabra TFB-10046 SS5]
MLRKSNLKGYDIPGLEERLIATLYADDTTVYLSSDDDYDSLIKILQDWCRASGAKFNTSKTEIIPLGKKSFRDRVLETRKMRETAAPVPDHVKVVRDGEAIRILGAWPGNGVEHAEIWSTKLDKLNATLDRWEKTSPTAFGKGIISKIIIGGHTQYLTAAQGMPDDVQDRIEKITVDFFWGEGKKHLINIDTLRKPLNEG